ncbi:MAG: ion transporter [Pseudomonadota bacterium]
MTIKQMSPLYLLEKCVQSPITEKIITVLLVINAITLGLETSPTVMNHAGSFILALDIAILTVFVIEILARLIVKRFAFFTDGWNVFDLVIISFALVPSSGPFQVLRALRIIRILRLASTIPSMRRVVSGLVTAIPGMGTIILLLSMIFYLFAVIATNLYGPNFPEWFGTIGASLYSLFQIMTLESWSMGIVRPVMERHPEAWLFFVPFILLTSFTVLNLFIGIIVSSMQQEYEETAKEEREALHKDTETTIHEVRELRKDIAKLYERLERSNLN